MERYEISKELKQTLHEEVYDVLGCGMAVHKEMRSGLSEYIYQDAMEIALTQAGIPFLREYHFVPQFRNTPLKHDYYIDFYIRGRICFECKSVEAISSVHRQQLWNYMRLTRSPIGILYNFAPPVDQVEKYYYDLEQDCIAPF